MKINQIGFVSRLTLVLKKNKSVLKLLATLAGVVLTIGLTVHSPANAVQAKESSHLAPTKPTYLVADGKTDTYTLINRVLGEGAEEPPDCSHPDFGPHIQQESDKDLGRDSFVFFLHVTPDNDRCQKFDRQRNEIKIYNHSPDNLKGFKGDTVTFRWKFKLDAGFQPSRDFTHIHQIKVGNVEDTLPVITLTPRAGNPDKLQIINIDSKNQTNTLLNTELAPFKGRWVEAFEKITYGSLNKGGTYSITLTDISRKTVLLTYNSNNIDMWRTNVDTKFMRPKWGIYRSLNNRDSLRDEAVKFNDFCLAKGSNDC